MEIYFTIFEKLTVPPKSIEIDFNIGRKAKATMFATKTFINQATSVTFGHQADISYRAMTRSCQNYSNLLHPLTCNY